MRRHGLEDGIDPVAIGQAGAGGAAGGVAIAQGGQEGTGNLGPGGAGRAGSLGRAHGPLGVPLGLVYAGQLVRGLDHAGRPQHSAGVDQFGTVEHSGPGHGAGHPVHRHPAAGDIPEDLGDGRAHRSRSVVQLGPQRSTRLGADRSDIADRVMGMKPGRTGGRADDGHRTTVIGVAGVDSVGNMSGGVGHVGTVQQHGPIHALSPHLVAQPGQPLRSHAAEVEHVQAQHRP